jgi:threonine dehydrogenase-like Zn-dependent dehydrogenase
MDARALVMVGERTLELWTVPVPDAAPPGGAIIRILANGLCGSDYDLYDGKFAGTGISRLPLIPGHEPVGRIEDIDRMAAHSWQVTQGDRIAVEPLIRCGMCPNCRMGRGNHCTDVFIYSSTSIDVEPGLWGGLAEYMVLKPGTGVYRVPDNLSDEDAVLFNPLGNAFQWACCVGGVSIGDRVLVLGAGQRGIACALVANECGASEVIVTGLGRDSAKLALAHEFGATTTIDVEANDTIDAVRSIVRGGEVDVVIDTTPSATDPILHAIELLRPEGTLVVAGMKGREIRGLNTDRIFLKALRIVGAYATVPWATEQALRVLGEGRYPFHKLHSMTVPLEAAEQAIQMLGGEVEGQSPLHITVVP